MTAIPEIRAIEARHKEIAEQIEKLRAEAEELSTTLRVLSRYASNGAAEPQERKLGPARPANTPTLFEMVRSVLIEAQMKEQPGLTSKELLAAIDRAFWPGVKSDQVLPSVYRFVKLDRLGKDEKGRFFVPAPRE